MIRRSNVILAAFILALGICAFPALAQMHGGGGGRGPGGARTMPGGGPGSMPGGNPGTMPGGNHGSMGEAGPSSHSGAGGAMGTRPEAASGKTMSDLLTQNNKLASQINNLTGMDAQTACSGFKNLGQCVSAAHASKNLGIDFGTLKGKVTGPDAKNLGNAIHGLNPNVNAKSEAKKAQKQAHTDLRQPTS